MILGLLGCAGEDAGGWFVELHGRLVDEAGDPVSGALARFATEEGRAVATVTTDEEGGWHLPVHGTALTGNRLVAAFEADGLAPLRAHLEVNLRSPVEVTLEGGPWQTWQTTTRRVPTFRLAAEVDDASVYGQLVDAVTGEPAPGVALTLQRDWNAPVDGASEGEAVTDEAGRFVFAAWPAGWYTVSAAPTEATDAARFPVFLSGAGAEARGAVSPHVAAGQLRATILWGSSPFDLDLHLTAALKGDQAGEDGNGRYHVYTGEPTHPDQDPDGAGYEAEMERTSNAGGGPETVAIHEAPGPGEIRLSVIDMDHFTDPTDTALGDAGVVLQVWYGTDLPRYYTVSPGEVATWWGPVGIDAESAVSFAAEEYAVDVNPGDADAF